MTNTIFPKPDLMASNIEKSRIVSPFLENLSSCFSPPYLLPIPAAKISKVGFLLFNFYKLN